MMIMKTFKLQNLKRKIQMKCRKAQNNRLTL